MRWVLAFIVVFVGLGACKSKEKPAPIAVPALALDQPTRLNVGPVAWLRPGVLPSACGGGDMAACRTAGVMYEYGRVVMFKNGPGIVVKDEIRAAGFYLKACDGGDMAGCHSLGLMYEYGVPKNETRAAELYQKACEGGFTKACIQNY